MRASEWSERVAGVVGVVSACRGWKRERVCRYDLQCASKEGMV